MKLKNNQQLLPAMLYSRNTPGSQARLRQCTVGIAGLGGLGSNIAMYLARCGVGQLHLVDFDIVEASNLNRQAYRVCDIGKHKTDALAEQLSAINPFIQLHTDCVQVTEANAAALFAAEPVVCEAFDNPTAKSLLINTLLTAYPEKYLVAASGMAGYGNSNTIVTRKITAHFYLCGDGTSDAAQGLGLMAPRVALCAAHQANQVLSLLLAGWQK